MFFTFTKIISELLIFNFMNKCKAFVIGLFFTCLIPVTNYAQNCDVTTRVQLKEKLEQMGFTVKTINAKIGEEKYEVTIRDRVLMFRWGMRLVRVQILYGSPVF